MKQIVGGQSAGKTRELMEYAKINNAIFVCENPYAMKAKAIGYGIIGLEIIGYYEFLNTYPMNFAVQSFGNRPPKFVIDEIVKFMSFAYFGNTTTSEFMGYTLTLLDED